MRRYNLLEVVKEVSRYMGAEDPTGLDESSDVQDIANICLSTLESLCIRRDWEFLKDRMVAGGTRQGYTTISLPANVARIQSVHYMVNGQLTTMSYLLPQSFLTLVGNDTNALSQTVAGGATVWVRPTAQPRYYTSFDEKSITLDAFAQTTDADGIDPTKLVLQANVFLNTDAAREGGLPVDTWEPDIPSALFPLWVQESVVSATGLIMGVKDQMAMREARRLYTQLLQLEPTTGSDSKRLEVNYGRQYRY